MDGRADSFSFLRLTQRPPLFSTPPRCISTGKECNVLWSLLFPLIFLPLFLSLSLSLSKNRLQGCVEKEKTPSVCPLKPFLPSMWSLLIHYPSFYCAFSYFSSSFPTNENTFLKTMRLEDDFFSTLMALNPIWCSISLPGHPLLNGLNLWACKGHRP